MKEEIIRFNEIEIDIIFYHKNKKYIKLAGQLRPTGGHYKGSHINALELDREDTEFKRFSEGTKIQLECITIEEIENGSSFKYYGKHNKLFTATKWDNQYGKVVFNARETVAGGRTNYFFLEWKTPVIPLIDEEEPNVT